MRFILLCSVILVLCSCSAEKNDNLSSQESDVIQLSTSESHTSIPPESDFFNIGALPKSNKIQSLENIAKILFTEFDDMQVTNMFAIDIGNKGMYLNPKRGTEGIVDYDYALSDEDVKEVRSIIGYIPLDQWSGYENADLKGEGGYSWYLDIQYLDGTVKTFSGNGRSSEKKKAQPEGYSKLVEDLTVFMQSKK
ncbi:hypothetical protein [uncultured Enterococcus sp.]|uniref:hypothetical protein n=1 Tax=uncultured Enterococcus sp. TaxID=167972 RepID=UPI002AA83B4A|nr:hypothetical protein [uncultured Enterococcus sp.]